MIGIIDYKAGNGPSVLSACNHKNIDAVLTADKQTLKNCSHIILPGVGSAGATMNSLKELGLIDTLNTLVIDEKKPFLGICVGLQVLFEHSQEDDADCLGWLKGDVVKFDSNKVRVPQIGWNSARFVKNLAVNKGLSNEEYFYFVNSYHIRPKEDIALAYTSYGDEFCSMVAKDNIYASQFHIEKSGEIGLKLLENFAAVQK